MSYTFNATVTNQSPIHGINITWFRVQQTMVKSDFTLKDAIVDSLNSLSVPDGDATKGKLFMRYPGGTMSQAGFNWNGAKGDETNRSTNRSWYQGAAHEVSFGIPEYFDALGRVPTARMLYVLNIIGYAPDGVEFDYAVHKFDAGVDGDPLDGNDLYDDIKAHLDFILQSAIYKNGAGQPKTGSFPNFVVGNETDYTNDNLSREETARRMNVAAQAIKDAFLPYGGTGGNVRVITQMRSFNNQSATSPNAIDNATYYATNLDSLLLPNISYHEYTNFLNLSPAFTRSPSIFEVIRELTFGAWSAVFSNSSIWFDEIGPNQTTTGVREDARTQIAAVTMFGHIIELVKKSYTKGFVVHALDGNANKTHDPITSELLPEGHSLLLYSESKFKDVLETIENSDTNDSNYIEDDGDRHLVASKINSYRFSLMHSNQSALVKPTEVISTLIGGHRRVRVQTKQFYTENDPMILDQQIDLYEQTNIQNTTGA